MTLSYDLHATALHLLGWNHEKLITSSKHYASHLAWIKQLPPVPQK